MAEIERDCADADGVYLFANDTVVDLYPKFGFRKGTEFLYTKTVDQTGSCGMVCVPMTDAEKWMRLARAMDESQFAAGCTMVGNPGLIFFYVTGFMQENVYYSQRLNAWAIAELEEDHLTLRHVFAGKGVTLEELIRGFGEGVSRVTLGFAPEFRENWNRQVLHEEDCTFFVKGEMFRDFEEKGLRIPALSHA